MSNRIVFIDSHIANHQNLIAQLPEDTEVVLLDARLDGIEQILASLQGRMNLAAIDIISHGSSGTITLGCCVLNRSNLNHYAEQLAQIGQHLTDGGDILLYGCEVAKGKSGQTFIEQLSLLTGADVAASTNLTGATELGGNWLLETHMGAIQTKVMQFSYDGVLAIITGTSGNDTLSGTALADTFTGGAGNDTLLGYQSTDMAIFSGNHTDYKITVNGRQIAVSDLNISDGNDGKDTLTDIEIMRFADGDYKIKNKVSGTGEFLVNTTLWNHQQLPTVTALTNGGFVVSWHSIDQDGSGMLFMRSAMRRMAQRRAENFVSIPL